MIVTELTWQHCRNLTGGAIAPAAGVNVICGDNAQGKTNLLELLWIYTGGRSFRRHFKKEDVFAAYNAATPGSTWSGGYYVDVATGKEKKNHVLVFEDLYIFGKGYMHMTEVPVPDKYKTIK